MDYLKQFEYQIYMYDGILTEMGRDFGEENGKDYICRCLDTADLYLAQNGGKDELNKIIDKYIGIYQDESEWELCDLMMSFLKNLKGLIDKI